MQGPQYARLVHLAMMLSTSNGWVLPPDGKALSAHDSAITDEVDGGRARRQLASGCTGSWSACPRKARSCPSERCADACVAFLPAAKTAPPAATKAATKAVSATPATKAVSAAATPAATPAATTVCSATPAAPPAVPPVRLAHTAPQYVTRLAPSCRLPWPSRHKPAGERAPRAPAHTTIMSHTRPSTAHHLHNSNQPCAPCLCARRPGDALLRF